MCELSDIISLGMLIYGELLGGGLVVWVVEARVWPIFCVN